jgi:hypothetical protein
MELRASSEFPASAATLAAILADPEFYRAVLAREPGGERDIVGAVAVTGTANGALSVAIRRTMAASILPEQIQGYLPGGLDVRQVNVWDAPAADGSRHGTVTMDIMGAPLHLQGTLALVPRSEAVSALIYHTRLRASIPFVGATIEQAAAPTVRAALAAEHDELLARLG